MLSFVSEFITPVIADQEQAARNGCNFVEAVHQMAGVLYVFGGEFVKDAIFVLGVHECITTGEDVAACVALEFVELTRDALAWGTLRTGRVGISGTDYVPPIPNREECERELAKILTADDTATAKALAVFAWGTRAQLFWDGNKRTSLIAANKILLMAGAGMLTVREQNIDGFNAQLLDYYNTGEAGALLDYLYENAIQGIEY